jgi:hypothetical protein
MHLLSILFAAAVAMAQAPAPATKPPVVVEPKEPAVDFVCPMDPDVHSPTPGKCPRCGMALVPGIPDPVEYELELTTKPAAVRPANPVELKFRIIDPKDSKQVREFLTVHEKLFHLFLVSQDLSWFAHEHPVFGKDAAFRYTATFPKPGIYRVLSDFYPKGGTPQLLNKTVIVGGGALQPIGAKLDPDVSPKKGQNLDVSLTMDPPQPIAGMKTLLFFRLNPSDGVEPYLGAWGHMLAASSDLIDTIHTHPFLANGGPQIQFNMIFPRPGVYRVWVQFQRKGVVNTVKFDIPVQELK